MGKSWAVKNGPQRVQLLTFSVELGHSLCTCMKEVDYLDDSAYDLTVACSRAGL